MKCGNIWEKIGGRKFIGYEETVILIVVVGIFAKDYRIAGVIVSGLLIAYLIYVQANIKARLTLPGGSEIITGDTNGMDKETPESDSDSGGGSSDPTPVGSMGRQGPPNRPPQD